MTDDLEGSNIRALEGKNGWLFLHAYGGTDILAMYTQEDAMSPRVLARWAHIFEFRKRWFATHDICLATMVVPEACVVYPDLLPDDVRLLPLTPFERVRALLSTEVAEQILYPRQILAEGRSETETYEQVDTHWTDWGAYLAYRALMQSIRKSVPNVRIVQPSEISWSQRRAFGDLGVSVTPERSANVPVAVVRPQRFQRKEVISTERRDSIIIDDAIDGDALATAIIFRDSYATAMGSFLSASFGRIIYVSSRTVLYDLVRRFSPDVVICEIAERAMGVEAEEPSAYDARAQYDDLRLGNETASTAQRQSRTLLGLGRSLEALSASDTALDTTTADAPGIARALAHRSQIYRQMGNTEAGLECIRHAATLEPSAARHRLMIGEIEQARGRIKAAILEFRQATLLEPEIPLYWEALARALILDGCPGEAIEGLQRALTIDEQRLELHLLLIEAMSQHGNLEGAEIHARHTLEMDATNIYVLGSLASVLIRASQWAAAHRILQEGARLFPDNPEFPRYISICEDNMKPETPPTGDSSAVI